MRIVTEFTSKAAAEAAIAKATAEGRITGGHAEVTFNGTGGRTVWTAHCRNGSVSFCI